MALLGLSHPTVTADLINVVSAMLSVETRQRSPSKLDLVQQRGTGIAGTFMSEISRNHFLRLQMRFGRIEPVPSRLWKEFKTKSFWHQLGCGTKKDAEECDTEAHTCCRSHIRQCTAISNASNAPCRFRRTENETGLQALTECQHVAAIAQTVPQSQTPTRMRGYYIECHRMNIPSLEGGRPTPVAPRSSVA